MDLAHGNSTRKLLLWGAPVVVGHFIAVTWHLMILARIRPNVPGFLPPVLLLVDPVPIAGLLLLSKGFSRLACVLFAVPFGTAFVIGLYAHFLSSGTDNVLNLPPGQLIFSFQASALVLVVLEALGCWIGIRMFNRRLSPAPQNTPR